MSASIHMLFSLRHSFISRRVATGTPSSEKRMHSARLATASSCITDPAVVDNGSSKGDIVTEACFCAADERCSL